MGLAELARKIPIVAAAISAGLSITPEFQGVVKRALEEEIKRQKEENEAQAFGLTIEELRIVKAFPELVDWNKIGSRR